MQHGDLRFLGEVILIETVKSGDIDRPRRRFRKKTWRLFIAAMASRLSLIGTTLRSVHFLRGFDGFRFFNFHCLRPTSRT